MHLIDSLSIGGAERMAVNLCNALADKGCVVHLCASRSGGALEEFIGSKVNYFVLGKRSALDISAILRLRAYIKRNHIQIIHAHSSSFFMGAVMKLITGIRLVWHDHYGNRENLKYRHTFILRHLSPLFDRVFSVNETLRKWSATNLRIEPEKVSYLQNFPILDTSTTLVGALPGIKEKRIVCAARLNHQKDHFTLIRAMAAVHRLQPEAQLFLVGHDPDDDYSRKVKSLIEELDLNECIHLLGARTDIAAILMECAVGVLSSESEGLPVALLEYGLAGLAVVCTDVGECSNVLEHGKYGKIVAPLASDALATALIELLGNVPEREALSNSYMIHITNNYSGDIVAKHLVGIYESIVD